MVTLTIIQILQVILDVVWWIIFVQFVLSILMAFNVVNTSNTYVRSIWYALERMTDPIYRPIRRVLPNMGGLDFSPAIVLILLRIIGIVLNNIAISAATGGAV